MSGSMDTTTSIATTQMTNNFTNFTEHVDSYVLPFTEAWVIASTCILATFFVFGVTANTITVAVIRTSPKLQNRYYTFLISMCISDIVSAFVSILFLYRRTWGFLYFAWPEFFCRLYWGLDLWTSFATALHILSFAILRLIGVRWPTKFQRISSRHMKLWIASIWTITFFGGFIPHFLFNTVKDIDREHDPSQARWASCSLSSYWFSTWQVYVQIVYAIFLYLPAALIIGISITIAVLLKKRTVPPGEKSISRAVVSAVALDSNSSQNGHIIAPATPPTKPIKEKKQRRRESAVDRRWRKDKQAIYQLFLIVGSFLFGYIPLSAFHFYTGFTIDLSNNAINAFDWRFAMVQYMMLRFSECLNPVFYNLASKKMRGETRQFLRKIFSFASSRNTEVRRSARASGTSSGV